MYCKSPKTFEPLDERVGFDKDLDLAGWHALLVARKDGLGQVLLKSLGLAESRARKINC